MEYKKGEAPKLVMEDMVNKIREVNFIQVSDTTCTICTLILENGTVVIGRSACVSPENFDKKEGEKIAYQRALNKIWELEGYLLKQKLYENEIV